MEQSDRKSLGRSPWWPTGASAAVLIWCLVAIAWLSIPRYEVCPAIYPAPAGCMITDRTSTAVIAAVIMIGLFAGVVVLAKRLAAKPWVAWAATAALAIAAIASYRIVLY
ncbi:MAG: hypothetical protein ACK4MD_10755 [Demequina sp.]